MVKGNIFCGENKLCGSANYMVSTTSLGVISDKLKIYSNKFGLSILGYKLQRTFAKIG